MRWTILKVVLSVAAVGIGAFIACFFYLALLGLGATIVEVLESKLGAVITISILWFLVAGYILAEIWLLEGRPK